MSSARYATLVWARQTAFSDPPTSPSRRISAGRTLCLRDLIGQPTARIRRPSPIPDGLNSGLSIGILWRFLKFRLPEFIFVSLRKSLRIVNSAYSLAHQRDVLKRSANVRIAIERCMQLRWLESVLGLDSRPSIDAFRHEQLISPADNKFR